MTRLGFLFATATVLVAVIAFLTEGPPQRLRWTETARLLSPTQLQVGPVEVTRTRFSVRPMVGGPVSGATIAVDVGGQRITGVTGGLRADVELVTPVGEAIITVTPPGVSWHACLVTANVLLPEISGQVVLDVAVCT